MTLDDVGQNQQIKMIDETKLTSKKRQGVAHFIKYFPLYVSRVEQQLTGADELEIRAQVDTAYEKMVHSMFESLKQMATLDGDGEDKGQLNYHVLLVGECRKRRNVMIQMIDLRRKHALFCCRDFAIGNWICRGILEASRGNLQREPGSICQDRTQAAVCQIDCAWPMAVRDMIQLMTGFTGIL